MPTFTSVVFVSTEDTVDPLMLTLTPSQTERLINCISPLFTENCTTSRWGVVDFQLSRAPL